MIEVGEYIRTVDGIKKVIAINTGTRVTIHGKYVLDKDYKGIRPVIAEKNIFKYSENIIDLIEVGDYVNGYRVDKISINTETEERTLLTLELNTLLDIVRRDIGYIESVLTHEQFEAMKYKVEE